MNLIFGLGNSFKINQLPAISWEIDLAKYLS